MGLQALPAPLLLIFLRTVAALGPAPRECGGCGRGGVRKPKLAFLAIGAGEGGRNCLALAQSPPPTFPEGMQATGVQMGLRDLWPQDLVPAAPERHSKAPTFCADCHAFK